MPPMPPDFLQQLLARRDTWWGRESTGTGQGQSTGFNDLDQILAGGGWPEQGLVELLCPLPCPAVLHLLLPVLASDGPGARLIALPVPGELIRDEIAGDLVLRELVAERDGRPHRREGLPVDP